MIITYDGTLFEVDPMLGTAWLMLRSYWKDLAAERALARFIEATACELGDVWQRERLCTRADRFQTLLRLAIHDAVQPHLFTRLCVQVRLQEVAELARDTERCTRIATGLGALAHQLQAVGPTEDPSLLAMGHWLLDFVELWRGHPVFDQVCEAAGWRDQSGANNGTSRGALPDHRPHRIWPRRLGPRAIDGRRAVICIRSRA